jgi:GGDEF domain-containing protein
VLGGNPAAWPIMDIVSIKKFLGTEKPKPEDYIRFLQLLLKGISLHAVEANEIELSRFRQEVSDISGTLSVHSTAEEIDTSIGFVIRAVTGYNRMAARISHAHVQELQDMLAMMTRTIAFLSDSSKTGIEQLQVVEKNLHTASTISDVRVLRSKLKHCLGLVRSESIRLREESQARIAELQEGVERTATHMRAAEITPEEDAVAAAEAPAEHSSIEQPSIEHSSGEIGERDRVMRTDDLLTGLRGRDAAEDLIAANISQGKEFIVTLFLVDRFAQVSGRFGGEAADEVLLMVARHLGEQVGAGSLFKWSGPAFAAILESEEPLHAIEQRMGRVASKRFEKTLEINRRMVLFPVACSFMVQKVSDADLVENIAAMLDDFVASN